jgi:hypothetical protein
MVFHILDHSQLGCLVVLNTFEMLAPTECFLLYFAQGQWRKYQQ